MRGSESEMEAADLNDFEICGLTMSIYNKNQYIPSGNRSSF